jgi:hypothetical protein
MLSTRTRVERRSFRWVFADQCPGDATKDVRFGSQADVCVATSDVCFTPDSDHESGHVPMVIVCFALESRHVQCNGSCLLRANSGHRERHPRQQKTPERFSISPEGFLATGGLLRLPGDHRF